MLTSYPLTVQEKQKVRYEGCGTMRPDPAAEPSMEDILASIRKIIAEDPPGSRPVPEPRAQTPAPAASRAVARDAEPVFQRASPEPYLRQSPRQEPFPSYPAANMPDFSQPSFVEPELPSQPRALSIDDQLSELLGDGAQPTPAAPVPGAKAQGISTGPTADFIARMTARPVEGPLPIEEAPQSIAHDIPAKADTRPGFTVSRAGFVPESTPAPSTPDPFEFNLGPSPFASCPSHLREDRTTVETSDSDPADLGSIIPVRHFAEEPVYAPSIAALNAEPENTIAASSSASADIKAPDVNPVPAILEAAPAIEPEAPVAHGHAPVETVHAAADAEPPASLKELYAPASVRDEIVVEAEPAVHLRSVAPPILQAQFETVTEDAPDFQDAPTQSMTANGYEHAPQSQELTQRSMEDTVAELLRPMLKTWLAENMPKIVERALRKEIAERNLIEHKTAAE